MTIQNLGFECHFHILVILSFMIIYIISICFPSTLLLNCSRNRHYNSFTGRIKNDKYVDASQNNKQCYIIVDGITNLLSLCRSVFTFLEYHIIS